MKSRNDTWRLTVKQADGRPLLTLFVECERPEQPEPRPSASAPTQPAVSHSPSGSVGRDDDRPMTEPQRRYLFRMLAQQGLDGMQAEQHLKNHFKVASVNTISRAAASQLIEKMLADRMEGRDGNS
jgi:hypothetical protein